MQACRGELWPTGFFLIVWCIALHAYGQDKSVSMVLSQEDFPLRPGLTVEYSIKSTLSGMDNTTVKHQYTESIDIRGIEYVKRVAIMPDGARSAAFFFRSDEGIVRVPAVSSSEESLVLKLPLKTGESWVQKEYAGTRCTEIDKSAETVETVSTNLGKLQCIKIRQHRPGEADSDEDSFIWVAKDYGIVKIEITRKKKDKSIIRTVMTMSKFEDAPKQQTQK